MKESSLKLFNVKKFFDNWRLINNFKIFLHTGLLNRDHMINELREWKRDIN